MTRNKQDSWRGGGGGCPDKGEGEAGLALERASHYKTDGVEPEAQPGKPQEKRSSCRNALALPYEARPGLVVSHAGDHCHSFAGCDSLEGCRSNVGKGPAGGAGAEDEGQGRSGLLRPVPRIRSTLEHAPGAPQPRTDRHPQLLLLLSGAERSCAAGALTRDRRTKRQRDTHTRTQRECVYRERRPLLLCACLGRGHAQSISRFPAGGRPVVASALVVVAQFNRPAPLAAGIPIPRRTHPHKRALPIRRGWLS